MENFTALVTKVFPALLWWLMVFAALLPRLRSKPGSSPGAAPKLVLFVQCGLKF